MLIALCSLRVLVAAGGIVRDGGQHGGLSVADVAVDAMVPCRRGRHPARAKPKFAQKAWKLAIGLSDSLSVILWANDNLVGCRAAEGDVGVFGMGAFVDLGLAVDDLGVDFGANGFADVPHLPAKPSHKGGDARLGRG